jgi:hypothetical protein
MTALVWTSCIKDEVAPEVTALRAAAVDYQKALTALKTAEAAVQTANAALTTAQVDAQKIANDLAKDNLRAAIAANDVKVAEAKTNAKKAELALQRAINELAEYIAAYKPGLAATYLTNYRDAQTALSNLYTSRADAQKLLDNATLLLSTGSAAPTGTSWDLLKAEFQNQLVKDQRELATRNAKLTADNAALTALTAVAVDPASAQTAFNTANAQFTTLKNTAATLRTTLATAQRTEADAVAKATATQKTITDYNTAVANLATNAAAITQKNAEIVDLTAKTTDAAIALVPAVVTAQKAVDVATKNLAEIKDPAYLPRQQKLLDDAKAELANAIAAITADRNKAVIDTKAAYDNAVAKTTASTAKELADANTNYTKVLAEQTTAAAKALADAQASYTKTLADETAIANKAFADAKTAYDATLVSETAAAQTTLNNAQNSYNTTLATATKSAADAVVTATTALATANTNLTTSNANLTTANANLAIANTALSAATTAAGTSSTALTTAQTALTAAQSTTANASSDLNTKKVERDRLRGLYDVAVTNNNVTQTKINPSASAADKSATDAAVTSAKNALIAQDILVGDQTAINNNGNLTTSFTANAITVNYTYSNTVTVISGAQKVFNDADLLSNASSLLQTNFNNAKNTNDANQATLTSARNGVTNATKAVDDAKADVAVKTAAVATAQADLTAKNNLNTTAAILASANVVNAQKALTDATNGNTSAAILLITNVVNAQTTLTNATNGNTSAAILLRTNVVNAQNAVNTATTNNTASGILANSSVVSAQLRVTNATAAATADGIAKAVATQKSAYDAAVLAATPTAIASLDGSITVSSGTFNLTTLNNTIFDRTNTITNYPAAVAASQKALDDQTNALAVATVNAKNAATTTLNDARNTVNTNNSGAALPGGNGLAGLLKLKADFENDKAVLETANTAAVASIAADNAAHATAVNATGVAQLNLNNNIVAQQALGGTILNGTGDSNGLGGVLASLRSFVANANTTGINADIELLKTTVELSKDAVAAQNIVVQKTQANITDQDNSKARATAILEDLKAEVKNFDTQIAAQILLAAKWKALLDAALG